MPRQYFRRADNHDVRAGLDPIIVGSRLLGLGIGVAGVCATL